MISLMANKPSATVDRARCDVLGRGVLRVGERDTFAEPAGRAGRRFLDRILSLECVQQIEIHPAQSIAEIKFAPTEPVSQVLRRMAEALRQNTDAAPAEANELHLARSRPDVVRVFRYAEALTTWEIVHQLPER